MTPECLHLVRESWAMFQPVSERGVRLFYERVLETDPLAAAQFAAVDMSEQHRRFLPMMDDIVRWLDQPEQFVPAVAALARRHVGYGVKDSQYELVGDALIWTLEETLGPAFTPDVRDAWTEAYRLIASIMRRATARTTETPA